MSSPDSKQRLKYGYTNATYLVQQENRQVILQEKHFNGFNHLLDYNALKKFEFVPQIYKNTSKTIEWEYIQGVVPKKSTFVIREVALMLRELHTSNLRLPHNNLLRRQDFYLQKAQEINSDVLPPEMLLYKDLARKLHDLLDENAPIHADPWPNNLILTPDNKLYLIDWEFACTGDFHWDLAYFIDSAVLDANEAEFFLRHYGVYDQGKLAIARFLVNYISVAWIFTFADWTKLFDYQPLLATIKALYPQMTQLI